MTDHQSNNLLPIKNGDFIRSFIVLLGQGNSLAKDYDPDYKADDHLKKSNAKGKLKEGIQGLKIYVFDRLPSSIRCGLVKYSSQSGNL